MKKLVTLFAALLCFVAVFAEPMKMASKAEIQAAKSAADGLVKSGVSADEALQYAEEASKSAEKYQLYCAAFKLYAKDGKADEAADIIKTIQAEFLGVPDKDIVSMIEQNAKKLAKDNAELGAALNISKARASASQQLSKAKKDLKKSPNSVELKYLVAESYAILGDWKAALKQFKDAGGTVWQIASDEYSGVISAKTAAFWWDYKPRSKFNADSAFKVHAAELYEKLIKDGELSVLEKATAEKCIEQAGKLGATKPKSELDKLKKICNTKGLVHCWRFNGDLNDCVGSKNMTPIGHVSVVKGCAMIPGGGHHSSFMKVDKFALHDDCSEFSLEFWATQLSVQFWARLFSMSHNSYHDQYSEINLAAGHDINGSLARFGKSKRREVNTSPWDLGKEFHFALIVKSKSDTEKELIVYKQEASENAKIDRYSVQYDMTKQDMRSLLSEEAMFGATMASDSDTCDANIAFNEIRVWQRALSEEEFSKNTIKFHKAGETMKK